MRSYRNTWCIYYFIFNEVMYLNIRRESIKSSVWDASRLTPLTCIWTWLWWNYCQRTFMRNSQLYNPWSFEWGIELFRRIVQLFKNVLSWGKTFLRNKSTVFCIVQFFSLGNKKFSSFPSPQNYLKAKCRWGRFVVRRNKAAWVLVRNQMWLFCNQFSYKVLDVA